MERTPKEQIMWRMQNVLRGQAMFIREDRTSSNKDRLDQMKIVETIKDFIDNFDEYTAVIDKYKKDKCRDERG